MSFSRLFALTATLLLASCGGGVSLGTTTQGTGGEAAGNFQLITDIPVPSGAKLDAERSLILGTADRWTGRVALKFGLSGGEAFAMFQQEMPNFGWQAIMSVQGEVSVLSFVRGERAATVQIQPATLWGSVATITVAPRQSDVGGAPPPSPAGIMPVQSQPLSPSRR